MRKLQAGAKLVLASHNQGKIREFRDLLAPYQIQIVPAGDLGLPEPEETGATFAENARIKALASAVAAKLPALSDDSGIEVAALGGAPGVISARWAGPTKEFNMAMARIERELQEKGANKPNQRRANFTAALCLAWPDGETQVFEGKVFGTIVYPPRGTRGFGYDPMFLADGETETFGEMDPSKKHAISHRARAFKLFIDQAVA